jgi:pSer/pThr/pTyr-binding forkhead associated (FHA) protein
MEISLTWQDPVTGEIRTPVLSTPIAIGRDFSQLPRRIGGKRVSRIRLDDGEVSRIHVFLDEENGLLAAIDHNSSNGIEINGNKQLRGYLNPGDQLTVAGYVMTITNIGAATNSSKILFQPVTDVEGLPTIPSAGRKSPEFSR